jgi:hypothetical protein
MKPPGPKEAAQRAMREASFEEQKKIEQGIRAAAAAGKAVLARKKKKAKKK